MATNKRITNLEDFKSVLPYQSELFGVYQPLIGWKSERQNKRFANHLPFNLRFEKLNIYLQSRVSVKTDKTCEVSNFNFDFKGFAPNSTAVSQRSLILKEIGRILILKPLKTQEEWGTFINYDLLKDIIITIVYPFYKAEFSTRCSSNREGLTGEFGEDLTQWLTRKLEFETKTAEVLLEVVKAGKAELLNKLFYAGENFSSEEAFLAEVANISGNNDYKDPYLTFDPNKDVKNVSISPLGIVHLFRQFFFEFDTFLGTPVGHVWMAPGSSVELIEVSQRKTTTEKYYETSRETISKSEKSETDQDEISEAVKKDNKDDMKLGFSNTVNQSWGTGNASATTSINMDKTQQVARETTHKRMREQTQKLSAEIRENYKSTFKTITEVTDTSSKRYVLANNTQELINYELRRKMRQVGVQVQDVGSYLSWQTFVDDPGKDLGLGNLVHVAKPIDFIPVPPATHVDYPAPSMMEIPIPNVPVIAEDRLFNESHPETGYQFIPLLTFDIPAPPDGYKLAENQGGKGLGVKMVYKLGDLYPRILSLPEQENIAGIDYIHFGEKFALENQADKLWFMGMFIDDNTKIRIGFRARPSKGYAFTKIRTYSFKGTLKIVYSDAKKNEIDAENAAKTATRDAADEENKRNQQEATIALLKDRVDMASKVKKRKFEDLREEERIIVYRKLIGELMTTSLYQPAVNSTISGLNAISNRIINDQIENILDRDRHVMSELINSIFDVDKMLYFVAPEWWQPREQAKFIGVNKLREMSGESVISWSDSEPRPNNYLITNDSEVAPLGSSLGWLLQLDGDNLRNAFLNAPWVKAVIPIRPGKELAAINWLKNVGVEGTEGLENAYSADQEELQDIRRVLLDLDANDPVKDHAEVTISDAIRFLCIQVSEKHKESTKPKSNIYPNGIEIDPRDKVSSTPIDKVYEYGFYPLQGSFRYDPAAPDPNDPDKNFQIFDQWIEILPTDQVVPVEVKYDPKTGRQI